MDPNLTLAHITHNTAVVLLHQGIAYPSTELQSAPIKLPSQSSAETCLAGAIEVATIAEQFLRNSRFLANHQFAFCLFVCGRMLLAHSSYYDTSLATSFNTLTESLLEISRRWNGVSQSSGTKSGNLASKFASRLRESRDFGATTFDIRQAAYLDDEASSFAQKENDGQMLQHNNSVAGGQTWFDTSMTVPHASGWKDGGPSASMQTDTSPDSISLAFPPLPQAFQTLATDQPRATTPMLSSNTGSAGAYGLFDGTSTSAGPSIAMEDDQQYHDFGDIDKYLEVSFLPDQRISMFSHPDAERE